MSDPIYVVKVEPVEANPGESGENDGCLVYYVTEEVDGEERQRSEVGRVGYRRRTSKWKGKMFHVAQREARDIAERTAEGLNDAVTRAAAARAAVEEKREAAIEAARERARREVAELEARIDEVRAREAHETATITDNGGGEIEAADAEVAKLQGALGDSVTAAT